MTEIEAKRARKAQQIVNAYHRVFKSEDGKLVLEDLKASFGMDRPTFIPLDRGRGSMEFDPYYAAKRDGQQDIRRHIKAKLAASCEGDANLEMPKTTVIKS